MVMDASPSPQSVGREFVRQYYTLLNQAPLHLHRFYSHNSSFVHGSGLDKEASEVRGQQEIHQRIMQLNFRDCKAKIRQVDAHATLSSGVVVQVSGELSNNGQPMRRFMQTFVLAPQSPKKYYVHNDIFRYQDEVFSDEEPDADSGCGAVDNSAHLDSTPTNVVAENEKNAMSISPDSTTPTVSAEMKAGLSAASTSMSSSASSTATSSSTVASDGITTVSIIEGHHEAAVKKTGIHLNGGPTTMTAQSGSVVDLESPKPEAAEKTAPVVAEVAVSSSSTVVSQEKTAAQPAEQAASNEPRTYANLVKSGAFVAVAPSLPPAGFGKTSGGQGAAMVSPGSSGAGSSTGAASGGGGSVNKEASPGQSSGAGSGSAAHGGTPATKPFRGGGGMRGGMNRGGGMGGGGTLPGGQRERYGSSSRDNIGGSGSQSGEGQSQDGQGMERRPRPGGSNPPIMYPDSQQVFVGNLPHTICEGDLEELFGRFGKVADVRINCKGATQSKNSGSGQRVPNFGFVVFEDEQAVQDCLTQRPIHLYGGHRLNVENKKKIPSYNRSDNVGGGNSVGGGVVFGSGNSGGNNGSSGTTLANRGSGGGSSANSGGGGNFDRGSQEQLGGLGRGGMGDRGRGSSRGGGPRGGGSGRGMYTGGGGRGGGGPPMQGGGGVAGAGGGAPQGGAAQRGAYRRS